MGTQSGARLYGDDYQHLFSWYKLLDLLETNAEVDHIFVEHPQAEATDDVTIHPKNPELHATQFFQIKAHTDVDTYSLEKLVTPTKSGTKSLLKSLWDSWKKLRNQYDGEIEIWLVSNWSPDEFLGSLIRIDRFKPKVFKQFRNQRTNIGQRLKSWHECLSADEENFENFCQSLRFKLGLQPTDLTDLVEAKMRSHNLKVGSEYQDNAIGIVRNWIIQNEQQITVSKLKKEISKRKLWTFPGNCATQNLPIAPLQTYLRNLRKYYKEWHIPSELKPLISWTVEPVPIDYYIKLQPPHTLPFLPKKTQAIPDTDLLHPLPMTEISSPANKKVEILTLAQAKEKGTILIMGSAGAGKSTCLKYLCHKSAKTIQEKLKKNPETTSLEIPVLVTLRKFGAVSLEDLILAQIRYHGLTVDKAQFTNFLDKVHFTLFFDGLDEVAIDYRGDLINELGLLHEKYPQHTIIITTRKQPEPPQINDFEVFEIQPLDQTGISAFAKAYLAEEYYGFMAQIEGRKLDDFIQVPLLLTLCLIIFRLATVTFDGLADIYTNIVMLYKNQWEDKRLTRQPHRLIAWDILEESLSTLAYRMVVDGKGYSVSRKETRNILQGAIQGFKDNHRWSNNHNVYDLIKQLLFHNFLEAFGDEINFWHASFRDYFAASFVVDNLPKEQVFEYAINKDWSLVTAFIGGLLPTNEAKEIRRTLVSKSLKSKTVDDAYWPVEILGLMGDDTTNEIIEVISRPSVDPVLYLAAGILNDRIFPGKVIFEDALNTILTLHDGYYDEIWEYNNWIPNINLVYSYYFYSTYTNIMLALSVNDVTRAEMYQARIDDLFGWPEHYIDQWLFQRVSGFEDFRHKLRNGKFNRKDLREFCRNTIHLSSIPYLEEILWNAQDKKISTEANIAIQCLIRL